MGSLQRWVRMLLFPRLPCLLETLSVRLPSESCSLPSSGISLSFQLLFYLQSSPTYFDILCCILSQQASWLNYCTSKDLEISIPCLGNSSSYSSVPLLINTLLFHCANMSFRNWSVDYNAMAMILGLVY